ncbi:MAG TPA: mersacidin/lichenicidin family type 2 lantibiotic [Pyrinomonadaceae bacterium]|nr:mersacidin/lichenicidin family type 2 lantibiotic [Pyrinomonadaceae bacterium]
MRKINIVRAWKDEDYRQSLSEAERAMVPQNPAGMIELDDRDLGAVAGGTVFMPEAAMSERLLSFGCCTIWDECSLSNCTWGGTCGILTKGCCY